MLKKPKRRGKEPIQTEPVPKISCEFKNIPLISFILVHCTDIYVVNYYAKFQFEVHTEKKVMKVGVTSLGANSYFEKNAKISELARGVRPPWVRFQRFNNDQK